MRYALLLAVLTCCRTSPLSASEQAPALPWEADFRGGGLDPAWRVVVDEGGSIAPRDGSLVVKAEAGARAHVEREFGRDDVTISAKVGRWASIYLVWDADHWCGVGKVSPTPFGRFYSALADGGAADEIGHRGLDFGALQYVRIQLGRNYVRFLWSLDGENWTELRGVARPMGFAGAPRLIAAGQSYSVEEKPFSAAEVERRKKESTPIDAWVSELKVVATPEGEAVLTDAQLKRLLEPKVDPATATTIGNQDDPTFERIADKYPAMKHPREIVGVPEHPLDVGVDRLGRLDVSPWTPPLAWFEVGDPPAPLGREGAPFQRRLLHGYLPVLTLKTSREGVDYELTVFGWSDGFRADKDLVAYVGLAVTGASGPGSAASLVWAGDGNRKAFTMTKGDDGRARGFVRFTYPKPDTAVTISGEEFNARAREAAAFWENRIAPVGRFDVPDPRVAEAYRAWFVYSMLNADRVDGVLEVHDGAGFYEENFGWSVTLHSHAADLYGLPDHAARVLGAQLHFQQPDGLYTQACGLSDPGALLHGLARHHAITGDDAWLRQATPNVLKLYSWLKTHRATAPESGPVRGLIKYRPYNDFPAPVYNYLGNAGCAQGMAEIGAALKRIDHPEADGVIAEAASYRKDVLDSMEAAAFDDRGMTLLPMEPESRRLLKMSRNRGGDYYGLVACSLLETDFLAPDDERARWIVDLVEQRGGLVAGLCEFQTGIDHAYTYGYLMNALKKDETRKVLLGFWGFLAFGMTRDTYSPVEISMIETGENHYTLPHLYSCTQQLRLLRNLLVWEQGDALWLCRGVPRAWLEPGKHVGVSAAPTTFGPVGCRIDAEADGSMRVRIDPPTRRPPAAVKLRLRGPSGRAVASAVATPSRPIEIDGETITLPGLADSIDLKVRFKTD